MTIIEANEKLAICLKQAKDLRIEIKALNAFLRENKADKASVVLARNKKIYKDWKAGKRFNVLASEHGLSAYTVSHICKHIDRVLGSNPSGSSRYKDLLKYK